MNNYSRRLITENYVRRQYRVQLVLNNLLRWQLVCGP